MTEPTFTHEDLMGMAWAVHRLLFWQPVQRLPQVVRRRLAYANLPVERGYYSDKRCWLLRVPFPAGIAHELQKLWSVPLPEDNRVKYHRRIGAWRNH